MAAFEKKYGTTVCLRLLDNNLMDTEEGTAAIAAADMFRTRCAEYVRFAVEKTEELMVEK